MLQEENCKISTDELKVDFTERGIVLTKERIQERSSSMGSCCSFHWEISGHINEFHWKPPGKKT